MMAQHIKPIPTWKQHIGPKRFINWAHTLKYCRTNSETPLISRDLINLIKQ